MKIFVILILLVCFTSCGKIETFTNLSQQKIETENAENEQPDLPPVLEITQDAKGLFDVTGKTLFFNLYENGIIEFEYEDEKKKTAGKINKAEEINTLKRAKISGEELQKFNDLLKSEDFQNAKDNYERKCCCTDASLNYKIDFQNGARQKNINLKNYCDLGELMNPKTRKIADVPQVLSDLLTLIYNTRAKYISR